MSLTNARGGWWQAAATLVAMLALPQAHPAAAGRKPAFARIAAEPLLIFPRAIAPSLYDAVLYVRGRLKSLGADAQIEEMSDADCVAVAALLERAGFAGDPAQFKRVASMRSLYHWNADADQEY